MTTVWERCKFPVRDMDMVKFPGKRKKLTNPFCWTPVKPFMFGGKRYIALYPCVAFETRNFGFIVQQLWDSQIIGRE